ncbi:MAG: 4-(cytidine 5'-diphospho)-2-C-methyl-D-erythritol kinase [FCB group bacterium]|nr:4-(cytidine 5'-diphospho)-2-C-methyl-D-erythritol kinase [FCB group bacterium]
MERNPMTRTVKAHAKINIGLKITGCLDNGYHTLHSLFQEISLHDRLTLTINDSGEVRFTARGLPIPGSPPNLVEKAARLLQQQFGITAGAVLQLEKNIPIGAGLGGGSSDAAAALTALNYLWKLDLSTERLITLAASLGADVPFFIRGGLQLAEGIGEVLSPIEPSPFQDYSILLVTPDFGVSTAWAYAELNKVLQLPAECPKFAASLAPVKWQLFENDFERVLLSTYPEVGKIKSDLLKGGAVFAGLSGSGSTMFGIFDHHATAKRAAAYFPACRTFVTHPVDRSD